MRADLTKQPVDVAAMFDTVKSVTTVKFDGSNWEAFYAGSGIDKCSKA